MQCGLFFPQTQTQIVLIANKCPMSGFIGRWCFWHIILFLPTSTAHPGNEGDVSVAPNDTPEWTEILVSSLFRNSALSGMLIQTGNCVNLFHFIVLYLLINLFMYCLWKNCCCFKLYLYAFTSLLLLTVLWFVWFLVFTWFDFGLQGNICKQTERQKRLKYRSIDRKPE